MKKLVLLSLLTSSLFFNISCDSDELVAGAIGVGVGVGIGRHYERHHDRRHRHGHDRWIYSDAMAATTSSSTQAFAQRHHIPLGSAQKIERAFDGLDNSGLASFASIGLNRNDLETMANGRMPAEPSVQRMSSSLGITNAQGHTLLAEMNQKFAASARDVNSDYWQACMEKGTWRTPQNQFCQKTFWNGCSPETGARVCY